MQQRIYLVIRWYLNLQETRVSCFTFNLSRTLSYGFLLKTDFTQTTGGTEKENKVEAVKQVNCKQVENLS